MPPDRSRVTSGRTENESHPLDWLERTGASGALLHELELRRKRRARRRRALGAMGGMVALAIFVSSGWLQPRRGRAPTELPASATVVSVPERRVLPDGSVAELKDDAVLTVNYTARLRRVVLERGEAHFQVAKNDAVPFVVVAGRVEIRAVGTAFSVRAAPVAVEVLVAEGRVAVAEINIPEAEIKNPTRGAGRAASISEPVDAVIVGAGNRVVVASATPERHSAGPQVSEFSPAELDEAMAWRVPRIEFSGTPLVDALPVFNRHARVRVSVGDPALERLLLSGILRADNIDALVRLLEANYAVVAERREGEIVLRKREPIGGRP